MTQLDKVLTCLATLAIGFVAAPTAGGVLGFIAGFILPQLGLLTPDYHGMHLVLMLFVGAFLGCIGYFLYMVVTYRKRTGLEGKLMTGTSWFALACFLVAGLAHLAG